MNDENGLLALLRRARETKKILEGVGRICPYVEEILGLKNRTDDDVDALAELVEKDYYSRYIHYLVHCANPSASEEEIVNYVRKCMNNSK